MKSLINLLFISLLGIGSLQAKDFYVATTGSNSNDGLSITTPFLTIQKASNTAVNGDIVHVRAGTYREQVGMVTDGVTYQNYNNELVTISGAEKLSTWTLSSGATYSTTDMNWDLASIPGYNAYDANQLFVDQKMINLARWPDQTSTDLINPTDAVATSVTYSGNLINIICSSFTEPAARWVGAQIWVNTSSNGHDGEGWTGTVLSVSGNTITFDWGSAPETKNVPWAVMAGTQFYLCNPTSAAVTASGGVDALLSPGEWWKNGTTTYIKMPNSAAPGNASDTNNVVESKKRHMAFIPSGSNKNNITIRGFNLFACAVTTDVNYINNWARTNVTDSYNYLIENLNVKYADQYFSNAGVEQVNWDGRTGFILSGQDHIMQNCVIQYSAGPVVSISGYRNKLLKCTFTDCNYMFANAGVVTTGYTNCFDAEIGNNTITNTVNIAISIKGLTNADINKKGVARIHHNTIIDAMRRGWDSGAIDGVSRDGQWTRVDHNTIYNTVADGLGQVNRHGIYLDFGAGATGFDGKYIIDHNVIYNVYCPMLLNHINDIWVYNNTCVYVGDPKYAIINGNGGTGSTDIIANNIFGGTWNDLSWGSLKDATKSNNIFDATGTELTNLFVDPANRNFHLLPTATAAIDKGISVGVYDENVVALPDLGAFEQGTIVDTQAPTVPTNLSANTISNTAFALNWTASTDNVQVTGYDIYLNGNFYVSSPTNSATINGLSSSTAYTVTVLAKDYYNNKSAQCGSISVTTLSFEGRTIHIEAENYSMKLGGTITAGAWAGYKATSYLVFYGVNLSKQTNFTARVACTDAGAAAGAKLEVRLNSLTGSLLGTLTVASTGGVTTFTNQTTTLSNTPTGNYTVYILPAGTTINTAQLDWVEFSGGDVVGAIPTVPSNLSTSALAGTRFYLNWYGSIDDVAVTGYEVFKDGVSIGTTTSTSMLIEGLLPLTNYNMSVRANDASDNWSAQSAVYAGMTNSPKLTGSLLGTVGSWLGDSSDDASTVFDENINTFFDCTTASGAWVGLDLGTASVITSLCFYPRSNIPSRMTGGSFQASNSADFTTGVVTLYNVSNQPNVSWTGVTINNATPFRYVRYLSPKDAYGNIAELEFYGPTEPSGVQSPIEKNSLVVYPNPAHTSVTLDFNGNQFSHPTIRLIDLSGKILRVWKLNSSTDKIELEISSIPRGLYMIQITNKDANICKKLVIK